MTKYSRALMLWLPVAAALPCANTAHAGMLGWMDSAFTFREEQKPLVTPRRSVVPPRTVMQPYYPNDQHVSWSNFYTRTDLEAQDYLSSSASKVMRPNPMAAQQEAAASAAQAAGGWQAISEQAMENARAENAADGSDVIIGEPGNSDAMRNGTARIGRATRIGPAVEDWRNAETARITSRPGDYDYRAPVAYAQAETSDMAIGEPETARVAPETSNDPRYLEYNAKGQVTQYKVQSGDTLSGISGQPAIYNNWKLWPLIYSANRNAIGSSPSNLKKEQRLDIPRDYTAEQAAQAERRAGKR